jgi:hypothetical protein
VRVLPSLRGGPFAVALAASLTQLHDAIQANDAAGAAGGTRAVRAAVQPVAGDITLEAALALADLGAILLALERVEARVAATAENAR